MPPLTCRAPVSRSVRSSPTSAISREQQARLAQVKAERDGEAVSQALESLRQAAAGTENVMPYVLEAARAYATLGEMTQVLKDVFGEFREPVGL